MRKRLIAHDILITQMMAFLKSIRHPNGVVARTLSDGVVARTLSDLLEIGFPDRLDTADAA